MAEDGTAEISTAEIGTAEIGVVEVGMVEVGITEVGITEVGLAEVSIAEVGKAEICLAEVGPSEAGTAEIRSYLWMLLSPYIPSVLSLPEHVKLVLICHVVHLLYGAFIIERCGCVCKHFFSCFSIGSGSPLERVAQCPCSLRHDTGKPCLSKYITCC
jgi:hypothetical protein